MGEMTLVYLDGPSIVTELLKCGRGRQKSQCQSDALYKRLLAIAAFEDERVL